MRPTQTAPAAAVLALLACGCGTESKPESLFPDSNQVAGWTKVRQTRVFPADRLWEYIDGDAEKYRQAGVQRTLATDYRYQEKIDAVVDIYDMGTDAGAKKVFESESSEGSLEIGLGDVGRLYGQSVTFRKGRYFVRLVAYEQAPEIGTALVDLGRAIERRLGA